MKLRWRFGIIAGLFLAIFSLYPQFKMLYLRGSEWNGHYAYNDIDEVAYGAYLKALIDGRPRKNDPYTGRDDSPENPQPESLFSIQFAGPYTIALPARLFGIGAPWAMTISGAVAAFLTALAVFWLIGMITGNSMFGMAGSLVVLAGGALFAGEGAIGEILGTSYSYPYFPGFRRYVPAMSFPAFFLMAGLIWRLFGTPPLKGGMAAASADGVVFSSRSDPPSQTETESVVAERRGGFGSAPLLLLTALVFGYTVFSYFYVWTMAAAWLGCVGVCFLVFRPDGWRSDIKTLAVLGIASAAFLAPYAYLLSNRMQTMDDMTLLVHTRQPDLARPPELVSLVVLIGIAVAVFLKILALKDRGTLFAISLALSVFVVFNQQLITGQALQPIHYQVFIGNYVAGLAAVVTIGLIWRNTASRNSLASRFVVAAIAVIAAAWGFVECHYTVRILDDVNIARDEAYPVAMRLAELDNAESGRHQKVVLHMGIAEGDDLPSVAPQALLWARHQHVFAGVTHQENKERYYQQLYYQGVDERSLAEGMKHGDFVSIIAFFGWGRHTDRLNSQYQPLTFGEIDLEASKYARYVQSFDAEAPGAVRLDYVIAAADNEPDFSRIDRWYRRDAGERFGRYILHRLERHASRLPEAKPE